MEIDDPEEDEDKEESKVKTLVIGDIQLKGNLPLKVMKGELISIIKNKKVQPYLQVLRNNELIKCIPSYIG